MSDRSSGQRNVAPVTSFRARVRGGRLEPIESVALPEGQEVEVTIAELPSEADIEASRSAAGGWKGLVDAKKLIKRIYADRLVRTRRKPRL
jgi:hypothetical protein